MFTIPALDWKITIANILGGRSLTMLYTMSVDLQLPRDCAGLCDMSMFSLLPFVSAHSQVFTHHRSLRFNCSQASIGIFCGIHLRRQNKEGSSILFVLHLLLWSAIVGPYRWSIYAQSNWPPWSRWWQQIARASKDPQRPCCKGAIRPEAALQVCKW